MRAELARFPVGSWQGLIALKLDFSVDDEFDPSLMNDIRFLLKDGVHLIWVNSAPWLKPQLSDFLRQMASDQATSSYPMASIRPWGAEHWSNCEALELIVDVSALLAQESERAVIHRSIASAKFMPEPRELVWCDPPGANMTAHILQLVAETIRPEMASWVYTTESEVESLAVLAASHTIQQWGIRSSWGEGWTPAK